VRERECVCVKYACMWLGGTMSVLFHTILYPFHAHICYTQTDTQT